MKSTYFAARLSALVAVLALACDPAADPGTGTDPGTTDTTSNTSGTERNGKSMLTSFREHRAPTSTGGSLTVGYPTTGTVGNGEVDWYEPVYLSPGQYTVTMSYGGYAAYGDADLYVRFGAYPEARAYDCRPYTNSTQETCTLNIVTATQVYIAVLGYANGSNVYQLRIDSVGYGGGQGGGGYPQGGQTVSGTVGAGEEQRYSTSVLNYGQYMVSLTGSGDADLYVKLGSLAYTNYYDCAPQLTGTYESCILTINYPEAVSILVKGYAQYSGYTLTVSQY